MSKGRTNANRTAKITENKGEKVFLRKPLSTREGQLLPSTPIDDQSLEPILLKDISHLMPDMSMEDISQFIELERASIVSPLSARERNRKNF